MIRMVDKIDLETVPQHKVGNGELFYCLQIHSIN